MDEDDARCEASTRSRPTPRAHAPCSSRRRATSSFAHGVARRRSRRRHRRRRASTTTHRINMSLFRRFFCNNVSFFRAASLRASRTPVFPSATPTTCARARPLLAPSRASWVANARVRERHRVQTARRDAPETERGVVPDVSRHLVYEQQSSTTRSPRARRFVDAVERPVDAFTRARLADRDSAIRGEETGASRRRTRRSPTALWDASGGRETFAFELADAKGLNPNIRVYRYRSSEHFGPHVDERDQRCRRPPFRVQEAVLPVGRVRGRSNDILRRTRRRSSGAR